MTDSGHALSPAARTLVAEIAIELGERPDASAAELTDVIFAESDALPRDLFRATRLTVRATLALATTMIAEDLAPGALAPPPEAVAYVRGAVQLGLEFDLVADVLRASQHAYARLWRERMAGRMAEAGVFSEALGFVEDRLFAHVTQLITQLGTAYREERDRWAPGRVAVRSEQVRSILAGADVDVVEASSRLRYRIDAWHLAFIVFGGGPVPEPNGQPRDDHQRAADAVARAVGSQSALTLPLADAHAGWIHVRSADPPRVHEAAPAGLRIAFGRPGAGVEGFRRSHREAVLTRRVLELDGRATPILSFEDVSLVSLLINDPDQARGFVQDELGPLLDGAPTSARALETLEAYLEENASFVRTAQRLAIHENTAAYRIRRAEQRLGRPTGERQLELRTALRLRHFLGRGL